MALLGAVGTGVFVWHVGVEFGLARSFGFPVYYVAARLFLDEPGTFHRVYDDAWFVPQLDDYGFTGVYDIYNVHPPSMALMMAPIASLSPGGARLLWCLGGILLVALGLAFLSHELGWGGAVGMGLTPLFLILPPVWENLLYGQAYFVVFVLQCVFIGSNARGAQGAAGCSLGLMLLLKTAGVFQVMGLLAARQWRVARGAVVVFASGVLATMVVVGIGPWGEYLRLVPSLMRTPKRWVLAYQTVSSLAGKLFAHDPFWNPHPAVNSPWLAEAVPALMVAIGIVAAASLRTSFEGHRWSRGLAAAALVSVSVCLAPVGAECHYAAVLPAVITGWYWTLARGSRWWAAVFLVGPTLLLSLPIEYNRPGLYEGWSVLRAYPRVYGSLWLGVWLLAASVAERRDIASGRTQPQ